MPFTYDYECPESCSKPACPGNFEQVRTMETRDVPAKCPECNKECKRVILSVRFQSLFPGSYKLEAQTDAAVKESEHAQAEGFRSKMELETAIGQAHERAKELGVPVERILGGTASPFKGAAYAPSETEAKAQRNLTEAQIKAQIDGDSQRAGKIARQRAELDSQVNQNAAKHNAKREFAPTRTKEQCKKDVIKAQRERKMKT